MPKAHLAYTEKFVKLLILTNNMPNFVVVDSGVTTRGEHVPTTTPMPSDRGNHGNPIDGRAVEYRGPVGPSVAFPLTEETAIVVTI